MDRILGHKKEVSKNFKGYKSFGVCYPRKMELIGNLKQKDRENPPNIWKLNNIPQNKPWVKEDIKHETRNYF